MVRMFRRKDEKHENNIRTTTNATFFSTVASLSAAGTTLLAAIGGAVVVSGTEAWKLNQLPDTALPVGIQESYQHCCKEALQRLLSEYNMLGYPEDAKAELLDYLFAGPVVSSIESYVQAFMEKYKDVLQCGEISDERKAAIIDELDISEDQFFGVIQTKVEDTLIKWSKKPLGRDEDDPRGTSHEMTMKLIKLIGEEFKNNEVLRELIAHEEIQKTTEKILEYLKKIYQKAEKLEEDHKEQKKDHEILKEGQCRIQSEIEKVGDAQKKILAKIDILNKTKHNSNGNSKTCKSDTASTEMIDISSDSFWENSIRKLNDGLYVNWKTGYLSSDFEHALKGCEDGSCVFLNLEKLRLLSILVQGEGAVVNLGELNVRHRIMQRGENHGEKVDVENSDGKKENKAKTFGERMEDLRDALRRISPVLGDIIEEHIKDESGKGYLDGYRIKLSSENPTRDLYADYDVCSAEDDWDILADNWDSEKKRVGRGKNREEFRQAFLRRYYQKVCNSFSNKISNARNDADGGERIFGAYKMAQLYTNAYAKVQYENATETMLDFVEKWFVGEYDIRISGEDRDRDRLWPEEKYGRVMVLHGQPGDGKTTFCKKAVFAHCKEGWLGEATQVLLVSLNPNDSYREIFSGEKNKLNLKKALCLTRRVGDDEERYFCEPSDLDGALVIFDGYDELAGDLRSADTNASFWDFCRKIKDFAKPEGGEYAWNAIITSRTMCIKDELEERGKARNEGITVAEFAPLTEEQQDAMIDRMIQINEENGIVEDEDEKSGVLGGCSLKRYKEDYLPELRKLKFSEKGTEEFNDLLKIPSLFRMIVTRRFCDTEGAENVAGLFTQLVEQLFTYKRTGENEAETFQKNTELIKKYEDIAARIFQDNEDTCTYKEGEIEEDSELIYAFLTKGVAHETGRIGFLHGMFRQYFFARYIISLLEGRGTEVGTDDREKVYAELFATMRARTISEPFVWQMVEQFAELEHSERSSRQFRQGSDRKEKSDYNKNKYKRMSQEHLKEMLAWLDNTDHFAEILKSRILPENSDAEKDDLRAAEIAVFNMISCIAHIENVCVDTERIAFCNYPNVCQLLSRGNYARIYLVGLNLGGCNFPKAQFEYADLRGANLKETNLKGAQMDGALFMGAKIIKTILVGTRLTGTQFSDAPNVRSCAKVQKESGENTTDLSGAILAKANLELANLRGVEMKGANFEEAMLAGANLADAKAKVTCWNKANLKGAFLRDINLEGSYLQWACLEEAYMSGAHLEGAHLEHSRLAGAYLENANLVNTYFDNASLKAVWLDGAKLEVASIRGADLTDAFLTEKQYELIKKYKVFGLASIIPDGIVNGVDLRAIEGTGQTFCFGRYPQAERDKDEAIKWCVLKCGYDRALVISEDLLDCQMYNRKPDAVTWEASWLREWLNKVFVFKAFDEVEIANVAEVCSHNLDNPRFNTDGGRATWDRVFALSLEEAEHYFEDDMDRRAYVTPFAHDPGDRKYGAHISYGYRTQNGRKGTGWWWLRSPGYHSNAAIVLTEGGIFAQGRNVDFNCVSVRPAFWLRF